MTNVMAGVRILEVAEYAMVPAAAAVLTDWGADTIKVEHAQRGDAIRGIAAWGIKPGTGGFTYLWEPFNRGKRSIALDVATPEGLEVLLDLARQADIFVTNFLPSTRKKLQIDVDDIRAVNPKIIYARGSAQGAKGEEADKGGFDGLTYWMRSGAAWAATPANVAELVTLPAPAFGDIQAGAMLAGGLAAALYHRERTGEAPVVDISLLSVGMWAMQTALIGVNTSGKDDMPHSDRKRIFNPLANTYRTRDGRFIALGMLVADKYWPEFCRLIERPDLLADPRFATIETRTVNNTACIDELDATFAKRTLAEWSEILSRQTGQWSIAQRVIDLNRDEQAKANGYLQHVDYGDGRALMLVPAPVQFDETPPALRPAPAHGAHTEEILLEAGRDRKKIVSLKEKGVIR